MYDIIVIGAGPAGLTAALYALRADKSVLVLEKATFGGQITFSPQIENYPGFAKMSGNEFADKLVDQVISQGADIEMETVTGIRDNGDTKTVITEDGEHEAKAVIIATGVKHRQTGLPNENELVGEGISYCAVVTVRSLKDRPLPFSAAETPLCRKLFFFPTVAKKFMLSRILIISRAKQDLLKSSRKRITLSL